MKKYETPANVDPAIEHYISRAAYWLIVLSVLNWFLCWISGVMYMVVK